VIHFIVIMVFLVSGAAGLVYEVVWTRQLSLVFGVTTYATATVLAVYMGGLALGSYLFGRWIDRSDNPLMVYAALEAGIGLYALILPILFEATQPVYVWLRHLDISYPVLAFGRALLAGLVLLPPTTLMGGTFPVLTRYWVRAREKVGQGAGLLYFINTTGAIAGTLLAGFYLVETFGVLGTTRIAVVINLSAAAIIWLVARRRATARDTSAMTEEVDAPDLSATTIRLALIAVAVSGFTSLGYEVLWSRALLRFLYNSTYAFTTMLATFLMGIALGSALYTIGLRRLKNPLLVLGILQVLAGLGFVASGFLFPSLEEISAGLIGSEIHSFADSVRLMFVGSALIMLPPTILLGAVLPLATALSVRGLASLGRTVGRVYSVNTFGSIVGSLVTGFLLIPYVGMQRTLIFMVVANLTLGAVLMASSVRSTVVRLVSIVLIAAMGLGSTYSLPPDFFMRSLPPHEKQKIIFYHEGPTDTVAVLEAFGSRAIMYGDRRGTASTSSFTFNYFLGHLPMLLHPGDPKTVLHICFGVGNSLSAVAAHSSLERVDNLELSPHVLDAAQYFWTNNGVLEHPKVRTIIDDGRNYLAATDEIYDVIMLEPPETFTAGVINLYTREFYESAREHLAADGLLMQWVPTGEAPLDQERMLFRAFADVFPHATVWSQGGTGVMLIIGTMEPLRIDYERLAEKMQAPKIHRDFEMIGVKDPDHLLSFFRFDEAAVAEFVANVEPITDDRPVLDFSMPRYMGSGFGLGAWTLRAKIKGWEGWTIAVERLKFYNDNRDPVLPLLENLGESAEVVGARIEAYRDAPPLKMKTIAEQDWKRWE